MSAALHRELVIEDYAFVAVGSSGGRPQEEQQQASRHAHTDHKGQETSPSNAYDSYVQC